MYTEASTLSVFDKYNKLECPSAQFSWQRAEVGRTWTMGGSEVVYKGELQELEALTSAVHSHKYYVATSRELLEFAVLRRFPMD